IQKWLQLLQPWRRDAVQAGLLCLALMFVYCGSDWKPEPTFAAWAHRLPDGVVGQGMSWLAEHSRFFPNAGEAQTRQAFHYMRCNVQIGVRLVLPLLGLAAAGLGAAVVQAYRQSVAAWQREVLRAAAVAAIAWASFASLYVWPHALCYTTELWGGTDCGYLCVS